MSATAEAGKRGAKGRPFWRDALAPYARPRVSRSMVDLATSVAPYLLLVAAMFAALQVSYWLVLAIAVPASGFLVRTFIVFHDCAHGSFLHTKRANARLGAALGVIVFAPFQAWRHQHAVHHGTSGDLDRRGVGDVPTLTVAEYSARSWRGRLAYRLFRSPLIMFTVGPIYAMIVQPRLISKSMRPRNRRSVINTNIALAIVIGGLCLLFGWRDYLLVQGPLALMAGATGVWLFYVQHQFEDTYWSDGSNWSYADAALRGSSYLRLPQPLQFFTGNIGLHHVHHLSAQVPNYNLQRAHDDNAIFHEVPVLSLRDGLRATRLKLWDEDRRRLVTFAEARAPRAEPIADAVQ